MSILKVGKTKVPLFFTDFLFVGTWKLRFVSLDFLDKNAQKQPLCNMLYRQPIPGGPQSSKKYKNQYLMVFVYAAESN